MLILNGILKATGEMFITFSECRLKFSMHIEHVSYDIVLNAD